LYELEQRFADSAVQAKTAREESVTQLRILSNKTDALSKDAAQWLAVLSLGIDAHELKLTRFIPVRLHLVEGPPASSERLTEALSFFLETIGFAVSDEFPAEFGSWIKRFFAKSEDLMSQPEVAQRLEKVERALQLRGLDVPQAEVDSKYAEATARLIEATAGVDHAAIQIGALLFLKTKRANGASGVQTLKLSQDQLLALEKNQAWLNEPEVLLGRLETCAGVGCDAETETAEESVATQMLKGLKHKPLVSSGAAAKKLPKPSS
jgi:hypothetical protein